MSLKDQNVLITGASIGIGASIAKRLAAESANLILLARSEDKLQALAQELQRTHPDLKVHTASVDISDHAALTKAVTSLVSTTGPIDVLINNAGLAIGAPNAFPDLQISDIITMSGTNINGFMFATYAALNAGGMQARGRGTILNVTSTTGLEVPPFPGEAVYHASKACQEAFTNVLRTELVGTDIKVLALRPGVVATHFHEQRWVLPPPPPLSFIFYFSLSRAALHLGTEANEMRSVGFDKSQYDDFMAGFEPLVADDVAEAAAFMLSQKDRVSVKALDVVPTAQRSLQVFDREWNARGEGRKREEM
jgi:3-hydroxy acid dehydrogenase/malonic semialdehyde reductase